MLTINRKHGSFNPIGFQMDLSEYGKDISDIEDVFFSVKSHETDQDDELFLKSKLGGGITIAGTPILDDEGNQIALSNDIIDIDVEWLHHEYTTLTAGTSYKAGVFFKFIGDPVADENVDQLVTIKILQDFLHEN